MDRRCGERYRASIGLVFLVFFVIGNVHGEEICRTGCKGGAAQTFKYAVGTTYKYSYDGKIDISLSSAEGQSTSTEVKADVLLTQLADCNQVLRLQNFQVIGSAGKKIGTIPNIESPIRINNNDGILSDSICVVDGDQQNSINVKRAIASIFQASLKTGYETDVFGTCPTDSSSHKEGSILVVTKARNLNKCSYREHIQQDFLATAFNLNSEIKSSPLLNGEYSANLRIKNGILDQATVTEDYLYVPFSVGKNGAKAQIVSKLRFVSVSKDSTAGAVTKPRSIIFENPHPVTAPNNNAQTILSAVKKVAETVTDVVGEETAREFVHLLKVVKVSKKSDLLAVYNQVRSGVGVGDKDTAKRLFLDALLRSGNGDSIEAVLELFKQNELSETDSKLALLGLSFIRHATEGSVEAAVHLLDTPKLPREAYLGIGNIAGRYCRQHSCENNAAVKALTDKLLSKIGTKPANREQESDIIYALKGLANFHQLNDNVLQKLIDIAKNTKDYPNRIRVAALETFLADPCKDKLRNNALNILKDTQQDSEVRIKAYLVIAQCPNAKVGNAIKSLLEKEPSIQVGGFITSHIRSLKASANPDKALAKQHLGFSLKKRFPIDPRKYSFNGEFSYAVDTLGLAASAEADVIYSQDSWLPRSSSLNLTAQLFGHNFNLLEIETRQENLDRLVEHYFGPKGVLRNTSLKDVLGKGRGDLEKIAEYAENKLSEVLQRSKRELSKAEVDNIGKQIKIKTNELSKDLDLDLSLKAFGSEIFFLNLNQKAENIKPEAIIDDIIHQLSQGLDKLNSFQETLRQNLLFLDAEFDYPTSLGFPLRLAVEGSATVQVKAEGGIDIRKLSQSPENGQLKLKLIPSANIEVSGRLTLDALVVENGLKTVSTLYSSTGGDINLSWDKSTGFDLRYGLPVQEQKIISANHEIVFLTREQAGSEQNLPLKFTQLKDFSICLDQLSSFIGLTFCAEINGPNLGGQQIPILPFPLAGDAKFALTIENEDVSEYRIKQTLNGSPATHAELILETIGKNKQRKVALDLQAEYSPEQYVKALFSSPDKAASAEGRLINTNVEKSLLLRFTHDKDEFSGKVGVAISGTPERAIYKPILEYKTPAGDQPLPVRAEGQVVVEKTGQNVKYTFENVRVTNAEAQFSLNGNAGLENGVLFSDLRLSDDPNGRVFTLEGELKLISEVKQISFDGGINVNVENLENLIIKGQVDSPNLNLNKIVFEAHNRGKSNDRKIQVIVKSAGKNLISGNAGYTAKEESGKFIVEGSGNFKVRDESKTGNFKYILQKLNGDKNGETGTEISFDAVLGNQAIDSEFKITNKHFRLQNSYCEQKKECAYVEIDNKINSNDVKDFNQVLEVNLDLRKLGLSHEFGLKAVTTRKDWVIDHTVDAHFQNQENSKYQYSFYIHPQESGVSLTTPKRIVALEAKYNPPKNIKEGGKGSGEVAFYMDKKNHANKKTALSWSLDVDLKGTVSGQTKFTHPGLRKPLAASIKAVREGTPYNGNLKITGELDVFANDNQKIVTTYFTSVTLDDSMSKGTAKYSITIQSKGLDIDILLSEVASGDRNTQELTYEGKINYHVGKSNYENLISTKWSSHEVSGVIKVLNKVLAKGVQKLQISKEQQIIESEFSLIDNNPVLSKLEIKNYNTLTYSVGYKNTPNNKLLFNAGLIPSQIADVRLDYLNGGSKTNLFYATVKLDDANFLKSDHQVNSEAIKAILDKSKEHTSAYLTKLEALSKEWAEDAKKEVQNIGELAKKAAPNLQPLKQYYTKELQEFKNEILNDKSLKELGDALRSVLGSLVNAVSEIFEKVSQIAEEAAVIIENSFKSVIDTVEKELIPQIKEISSKAINDIREIIELSVDIALKLLSQASQIIEKYQPELKGLTAALGELTRDLGRVAFASYQNARENIQALIDRIITELKASPAIEELKALYEQVLKEGLPSADVIVNTIREIFHTIKDLIPKEFVVGEDINSLLDTIDSYIEKKLKNESVDDIATFEQIGHIIGTIIKKLISLVSAEGYDLPGANVDSSSLLPFSYLQNLPRLVAVKFSPLSYLLDQDLPADISKFLLSLVTKPINVIPPFELFGLIINQGQHIFTFDGNYVSFSGTCKYLFASDAVNGNFTVAGTYKNGLLASITLADKTDSITLLQGGKVKLNNANAELPIRKPEIAAYRSYEVITLRSTAGVTVECAPDLIGCAVSISGFYHGQVRGLLGTGNGEPYDDFTIPNGNIAASESDFVNGYKVTASCANVKVPQHEEVPENPVCTKLFSWESTLSLCYPFVPTENFKKACALGLAANAAGTEESIAKAYVAACQERAIPIHVPESLVKCTNGDKQYSVGDTFSVKLPSKAADIVLIVDTDKNNKQLYEKLVQSLVPEIGKELNAKGVNDVEIHLITYGGLNQWPSHVTVNGKLTFKGKPPVLKFGEELEEEFNVKDIREKGLQEIAEQIKEALRDLRLVTGLNLKTYTYNEAHNYPFRVNALKSIIVVNSQPCEVGRLYPLQKLFALLYKNSQVSLNLFTPFESLSLKNAKKAKDVIGFNTERVFTLTQGKKNFRGNAELHKELNYDDYCVDFSIKNRGNAFVNNNFLGLSDADQKQYVTIAAANIVDQLVNVEQGLDCECQLVNPFKARNVCKESYIKDRSSKKV